MTFLILKMIGIALGVLTFVVCCSIAFWPRAPAPEYVSSQWLDEKARERRGDDLR